MSVSVSPDWTSDEFTLCVQEFVVQEAEDEHTDPPPPPGCRTSILHFGDSLRADAGRPQVTDTVIANRGVVRIDGTVMNKQHRLITPKSIAQFRKRKGRLEPSYDFNRKSAIELYFGIEVGKAHVDYGMDGACFSTDEATNDGAWPFSREPVRASIGIRNALVAASPRTFALQ